MFNKSLESRDLPDDRKTAKVIILFKKGLKSDPGYYRPATLTCIVYKVLESVVRDAIIKNFVDNRMPHSFRENRSCVMYSCLRM